MASISLYDENQLCKIIEPAGAPNQLFYVHEVPEIVKKLVGDKDNNPNITLELYPIVEDNEKNINELNVESLIIGESCNNISFDVDKLFNNLFKNKKTDLNFISSFEGSTDFKASTVTMSNVNANQLNVFNINYPCLSSNYLKSHMYDTFQNVALEINTLFSNNPTKEQFLTYNMVYAWTEYMKTMYDEYINTIWNLLEENFNLKQSDYSWNGEELLKDPKNVTKVVNNTYNNEAATKFLQTDIFTTSKYSNLSSNEQIKFKYAANAIYIIVSQPINNIVQDFENMLNTNDIFKFENLLESSEYKQKIPANFASWISTIHKNMLDIKTLIFKDDFNKSSKVLSSIYPKLNTTNILTQWTPKFIKNVDLILLNSDVIGQGDATVFKDLVNQIKNDERCIKDWETYYESLINEFSRIINNKPKSLENDLVNDLITSISYNNLKDDDTVLIQKQFHDVFKIYNKNYKIQPQTINNYLNTKIDNKRIIPYAVETRFSKYEFKTVLDIINSDELDGIFNMLTNKDTLTSDNYTSSSYYTKIVSLYETSTQGNFDKFFNIYNNSIIINETDKKYYCNFNDTADYATISLEVKDEEVFSSSLNKTDKLFDKLKNNNEALLSNNIKIVINDINNFETIYLSNQLSTYLTNDYNLFTEIVAKTQYDNYCVKYYNKFILYDTEQSKLEDNWKNEVCKENKTPHDLFAEILTKYYEYFVNNSNNSLKTQYENCVNSENMVNLRDCINSLTNYLYDTGYYGKTTGLNPTMNRTIIIDASLNRSISFNIPMEINGKKIFEIINELESKISAIESKQLIDSEFKEQQFNSNVTTYKKQLQDYVDNCDGDDLFITITNYHNLKTLVIPDEYISAVNPTSYYTAGKDHLTNGSISTLITKLDKYLDNLASKIEEVNKDVSKYNNDFYIDCYQYYNSVNNTTSQFSSFLEMEGFGDVLQKISEFHDKIDEYYKAYENNKPQDSGEEISE